MQADLFQIHIRIFNSKLFSKATPAILLPLMPPLSRVTATTNGLQFIAAH